MTDESKQNTVTPTAAKEENQDVATLAKAALSKLERYRDDCIRKMANETDPIGRIDNFLKAQAAIKAMKKLSRPEKIKSGDDDDGD
jgi:hypothetical protein